MLEKLEGVFMNVARTIGGTPTQNQRSLISKNITRSTMEAREYHCSI